MSYLKIRNCPQCNKELTYTNKSCFSTAKKRNSLCAVCAAKNRDNSKKFFHFNNDVKNGIKPAPFKNNTHRDDSKLKMSESQKIISFKYKTDEFRKKMSEVTSGTNNPMYGKSFYDIWLEKYGEDEAEKRLKKFKELQSINTKGSKNPMYGKPSPQGSGNGWKGWYNGIFFRSLLELSFLVNYIERFNLIFENGELNKFKITYIDFNGNNKNYFSDFIINNKYMVEIKPKRLHNSKTVQLKANAAIEFCEQHNLIYKLIEPNKLNKKQILNLMESGNLIFMKKYLEKIINY